MPPVNVSTFCKIVFVDASSVKILDILSNLLVMCVDFTRDSPNTAYSLAVVPSALKFSMVTVGLDKYPLPCVNISILLITPALTTAFAVAPVPPPPVIVIAGVSPYPEPPSATVISLTWNPTLSDQCLSGYVSSTLPTMALS